jgi:hypothetical protein
MASAMSTMNSYLGYSPNYYGTSSLHCCLRRILTVLFCIYSILSDYRLQSLTCSGCYSYNYSAWAAWFLQDEVEAALNVCGDAGVDAFSGSAGGCIGMGNFDSRDSFDYSGALSDALEAGVKVLCFVCSVHMDFNVINNMCAHRLKQVTLYYGKTDTACNYVGGLAVANTIEWSNKDAFKSTPLSSIEVGGAELGQQKSYGGLTFIQVSVYCFRVSQ